jgi:hypothetical protein
MATFSHKGRREEGRGDVPASNFKQQTTPRGAVAPGRMTKILALKKTEGAGNAGRPMRPIAACAGVVVERTRVSQVTPESPGIPYAMVLTAYVVLSPAIGLSCHRRPAD